MKNKSIAALLGLILLSGCASRRGALTWAGVGAGTIAVGVAAAVLMSPDRTEEREADWDVGPGVVMIPVIGAGGLVLMGSLINLVVLEVR